jgi:hypothetical protein
MPCRAVSCSPACVRASRSAVGERRGRICDIIRERPAAVEGCLVPGHWEGDLITGAGNCSSVGTLVERTSRKLVKLADAKAETVRDGFAAGLLAVPAPLRLTLTDDPGKEMARHRELAALTGLRVYFADPHAPWQRGSNENTNGLLRQYLALGHRPVGVLASRTRRDRDPAQQAQDAWLRDTRRGVRLAGGQGRQRRHVTKCGGCSLGNLNPPRETLFNL